MPTNRLYRSLTVLVAIIVFALPNGSAFAKPIVEMDQGVVRSARPSPAANVNRSLAASRDAYYTIKIEQAELAAAGGRHSGARLQATKQVSVASARLNRYAAFKEQQMQRIMDGE